EFDTHTFDARDIQLDRQIFVSAYIVRNWLTVFISVPLHFERDVGPLVGRRQSVLKRGDVVFLVTLHDHDVGGARRGVGQAFELHRSSFLAAKELHHAAAAAYGPA